MADLNKLFDSIVAGKLEDAVEVTKQVIEEKLDFQKVISDYMITAMEEIESRFQNQKAFVLELLMSARAMKGALKTIKLHMQNKESLIIGKIVIGTVMGDLHDIGKNLVASMFEGCGFEVVDLGVNVSAEKFVAAVEKEHPDIICLSALLTTTMSYMEVIIKALETANLRDRVKVMVGGVPLNEIYAKKIGADAYTSDAKMAVIKAKELLNIAY